MSIEIKIIFDKLFDDNIESIELFANFMIISQSYENMSFFSDDKHINSNQNNAINEIIFVEQIVFLQFTKIILQIYINFIIVVRMFIYSSSIQLFFVQLCPSSFDTLIEYVDVIIITLFENNFSCF